MKGKWFTFPEDEDIKFLIKPFPYTKVVLEMASIKDVGAFEQQLAIVNECVTDWEGLEDENGKKLTCNKTNKEYVFTSYSDLAIFLLTKINDVESKPEKELKN